MNRDEAIGIPHRHHHELRRRGVARLAPFGSTVRDEASGDGDLDLLVDIAPGRKFSLVDFSEPRLYLGDILGREVDLARRSHLKPLLRDRILAEVIEVLQ